MGTVMIRCPATGQYISTGIEADRLEVRLLAGIFRRCLLPPVRREATAGSRAKRGSRNSAPDGRRGGLIIGEPKAENKDGRASAPAAMSSENADRRGQQMNETMQARSRTKAAARRLKRPPRPRPRPCGPKFRRRSSTCSKSRSRAPRTCTTR